MSQFILLPVQGSPRKWRTVQRANGIRVLHVLYLAAGVEIRFDLRESKICVTVEYNSMREIIDSHIWVLRESLRQSILGFSLNF